MTLIEPMRRPDSGPPRLHERPDADSQFGAELTAAVARRGPERDLRARRHEEDRPVVEAPPEQAPEAERAADDVGPTDPSSTDPVDAPAPTAVETGDESVQPPIDAVSADAPDASTAAAEEPRIDNGGACSCCTPGALRPVLLPTTAATPQSVATTNEAPLADPSAAADGPRPATDAGFPPPLPNPPPGMPPPAGPPAPLQPPAIPLPAAAGSPGSPGQVPVDLADVSVGDDSPDLEPEEVSTTDPDDLRVATTPVDGDPTMVALAAVPVPQQQPAATTAPGSSTTHTTSGVTGVVVGSVSAGVAATKDAGTDDPTDGDDSGTGNGAEASGPVTSTQQTGAELAASRITTATSQPVSAPGAPLRGQSVSEGVLRSEQVRVLRELAPNRDVQRLAVDLDGARVALRFDSTGARVDVVADPGNRLGHGWADDVQRTLNAGARHGANSQQRDPDGGRRNRQAYQAPNQVDERLAAEFSARLGAVEEG